MMTISRTVRRWMQRFARDERGVITVQNLFLTVACCGVGAVGVDVTNLYQARTQLQVAADVGAHAALYTRYNGRSEAQAQNAAVQVASYGVESRFGTVVTPSDVVFGTWNPTTSSFAALTNSAAMPTAVQVTTNRADDNPVASLLFRIIGVNSMNVRAATVYRSDADACAPMQGLFGQGKVWIRSGNNAAPGVCFHSNDVVDTQNNNDFQYTSTDPLQAACQSSTGHANISMPDSSRLGNGTNNECIAEAKQDGTYNLSQFYSPLQGATTDRALLSQVEQAMAPIPAWNWSAIDTTSINTVTTTGNNTNLTASTSMEGRVHYVDCKGHNLTLSGTWTNTVLLLNDCKVTAANSATVTLSDTVLYNTNMSSNTAFNFGSGPNAAKLAIGNDTDCDGTGAAYVLARGGFDAPAKMTLNNGTIITPGSVKFAAQFGGSDTPSRGLRVVAGETIDGTSNGTFIPCPTPPTGTEPVLATFRMAR